MEWTRLDGESDEELLFRIGSNKDAIGTWDDVANIMNQLTGSEYTESKWRKQYNTFVRMFNANRNHS